MDISDRDKRILKIAGPVLGGILVLFLAYNLFVAGGGEDVASPGPVLPTGVPPATPSPTPSPTTSPSPAIVFAGRDPFAIPSVFASASASGSPGASGSPSASGSPGTSSSPPITPSSATQDVGGNTVVLLDVFARDGVEKAQVEVDGTVYTVAVGERFAQDYRLVSVSGSCADFLYGEESFSLCIDAQR